MKIDSDFIEKLRNILDREDIKINEPLKSHTSFKIGGPADVLILPQNHNQISETVKLCLLYEIPYYILGNGSNVLISDKGIRGVVIKLCKNMSRIVVDSDIIECECGVLLSKLANIALENSLTGLEFASGIPGSVGGAVVMNAGAYDGEMKDVVIETKYVDELGEICIALANEHKFGYRSSMFQGTKRIILSSKFKLNSLEQKIIKDKMDEYNKRRKDKQPLEMPSAGSVFKRPAGFYAGKLIEDSGLKGFKVGGAMVSDKHCGFIVNTGDATAKDVIELIEHIQKIVKEKYGIILETEVKVTGET